ncbi:MAG: 50S ribosomal protein L24 [Bacillota bacterium]|jgi:large subunit ribosomal protein L24|nr:50S ribosomal protein L24 [Bacillota bacterium]HOB42378.1 50S ribosomal protein L24 [Bacillota bacterium]HOK69987.1 50S ribosomal protein L24 [Bacillota bacterium]HOL52517.1 50S ribosomal protein L24 [Bacillota bacterium]HOO30385.1 50S ribosomal protein L24 [Bacillota bacterium]
MTISVKKVKKGDTVMVLQGKDAGRRGKVLRVLPREQKVIVENLNIVKRHTRPSTANPQGGIIDKPAPMALGRVMVVCGKCNKPTRVGMELGESGKPMRVCKKCGAKLDKK